MLEIVIEEIIGWDIKEKKPRECGGLLGHPEAFIVAVEEQGRRTLHRTHVLGKNSYARSFTNKQQNTSTV